MKNNLMLLTAIFLIMSGCKKKEAPPTTTPDIDIDFIIQDTVLLENNNTIFVPYEVKSTPENSGKPFNIFNNSSASDNIYIPQNIYSGVFNSVGTIPFKCNSIQEGVHSINFSVTSGNSSKTKNIIAVMKPSCSYYFQKNLVVKRTDVGYPSQYSTCTALYNSNNNLDVKNLSGTAPTIELKLNCVTGEVTMTQVVYNGSLITGSGTFANQTIQFDYFSNGTKARSYELSY